MIVAPLLRVAVAADCALILENDSRLAARLGADGVHVAGAGEALEEALDSLKPERIVGAGALRMRDEAMTAGEMGADYVMFGETRDAAPAMACVAYAESIEAAGRLARAGADFVALDGAIWNASSPAEAARQTHALLVEIAAGAP